MNDLTCPKCQSPMRSYERSGVVVDQCTGCKGIYLDRGELERLIEAEDVHYRGGGGQTSGGGHRSGGFLGDLFEGGHGRGHGRH